MPERKPRKSVAFADGETIVDSDGQVTETNGGTGEKDSAESHSAPSGMTEGDKEMDEVTKMFEGLQKKKKSKAKKESKDAKKEEAEKRAPEKADDEAEGGDEEAVTADGEVDLSALKKKKKKKVKAPEDDFEKQLAEAGQGGDEEGGDEKPAGAKDNTGVQDGDLVKGTGIWAHGETKPFNYESLLSRFFTLLHDSHPDLASSGGKSYKIPPPQCLREGNKKTIFANIAEICKRMKRTDEHVTQFLFAELGTSGSVDGSRRLVIKGRFQQKQIENVLRRYISKFVRC